jgi:23S rRNA (cytosine1962-C5)-methyltransferase
LTEQNPQAVRSRSRPDPRCDTRVTEWPQAWIRKGDQIRIAAGHPWIYRKMIHRLAGDPVDGEPIAVLDARGGLLGTGFYNSGSRIPVRVLSRHPEKFDQPFFERRLRDALQLRERYMPDATCYRLVSSEADFLSGLIVDRYEDVLVLQFSSLGMARRRATIVDALIAVLQPRAIIERGDNPGRRFEGLPESGGWLHGALDGAVAVRINGLRFEADVMHGQKTGLYLDQQGNYRKLASLVAQRSGARVLDCFSFAGGFGLHCAQAGAAQVHMLDQSEAAIATARRNAAANGLAQRCSFEVANVFDWLKQRAGETLDTAPYDVVILDPPPFAPNRAAVAGALRGYKEIHLRALKLLTPGGLLATYCCSHHVDARLFAEVIAAAATDAGKMLRRVAVCAQSADHPVIASIPETEYLKGYIYEVVS